MYIERDLLKMAIEAEVFMTDSTKAAFRSIVRKVPAADVAPVVRGEWEQTIWGEKVPGLDNRCWRCSACGKRQSYGESDYCPNCGAKMDGGKENV